VTKQIRPWRVSVPITKVDEAQRLALGFASSATLNHQPIVDHHQDVIGVAELEKAGYHYVENSRVAGEMHEKLGVGTLVESVVLTSEKRRAMGLPDDGHSAWWIGFRVTDDETWAKVAKGELKEFSIGGEAYRDPHPTIAGAYALNDLVIKEVSFVDVGAGVCVPVALTKARENAMKGLKAIIAKIADPKKRAEIEAKIEVAQKAKDVAKGEVLTLADVQEALTPELFAVVLQAIESSAMMSGNPPAPPAEPPTEGGDGLELAKALKDELAKAKKATELAEKQREEQREETRKMATRLEAVEKERHFEKALSTVRKDLAGLPGEEKAHAEALMALDDIERFAKQGMPVVISAEVAKHLRTTLEMAATAIGQGDLLKTFGGGRGAVTKDPRGELEKLAKGLMDKDPKLTEHQAMAKAYRDRPDLYQALRAQPAD
jgi:hypothetical protein